MSNVIERQTRVVYMAPTAGRAYLTKRAAYNNEAKARFFARCKCEPAEFDDALGGAYQTAPPLICELHDPDGKYRKRREDGTTLMGRIIRRWARLLAAHDRRDHV